MFLLFGLVARREFFIRQRDGSQYSSVDVHAAVEIIIVGVTLAVILFSSRYQNLVRTAPRHSLFWYAAYLLYCCLTSPFSYNTFYSLFFAGECLSQILICFVIVFNARNQKHLFERLLWCCLVVTVLSVSFKLARNGLGGDLFDYKSNGGGACACISTIFTFTVMWSERVFQKSKLAWTTAVVSITSLVLTTSAASIISTLFGISIASIFLGKGRGMLIGLLVLVGAAMALNPEVAFNILFPGKDIEQVQTLHGRTTIWDQLIVMFEYKPLIGYGYAMGAKVGSGATNLHNSIITVLIGTGTVGFFFVFCGFMALLLDSSRMIQAKILVAVPAICAFAGGLVNSNSIAFFGEDWRGASCLFFLMWAAVCVLKSKLMKPQDKTG